MSSLDFYRVFEASSLVFNVDFKLKIIKLIKLRLNYQKKKKVNYSINLV